jgi:hypothetical protein
VHHAIHPGHHHPAGQLPSPADHHPRVVRWSVLRDVRSLPVEDSRQVAELADGSFAGTDWINRLHDVVWAVDLIREPTIENYDNKLHYARPVTIFSVTMLILLSRSFCSLTHNRTLIQAKRPNAAVKSRSALMRICR